jgi:hypothetical protein
MLVLRLYRFIHALWKTRWSYVQSNIYRKTSVLRKLEWSTRASLCALYSIIVSTGNPNTFFKVSLTMLE